MLGIDGTRRDAKLCLLEGGPAGAPGGRVAGERRLPAGPAWPGSCNAPAEARPQQRSRSASSAGLLWRADSYAGRGPSPCRPGVDELRASASSPLCTPKMWRGEALGAGFPEDEAVPAGVIPSRVQEGFLRRLEAEGGDPG